MNRRGLLKLLSLGVIGHMLDVDKLLWVPGQKTIFLPPPKIHFSYANIIALEMERAALHLSSLFERDDTFYRMIKDDKLEITTASGLRVPLSFKSIDE
jgi:hypothetical protein